MWGKQSPFARFPKSKLLPDGSGVHVTGSYHSVRTRPYQYAAVAALAYAMCHPHEYPPKGDLIAFGLVAFAFLGPLSWKIAGALPRKFLDIKFRDDEIQIGRRHYSRSVPLEFRIDPHRSTITNRLSARFKDVQEVVMQYGETDVVIAEMYIEDWEKLQSLTLRLSLLNTDLHGVMRQLGWTPKMSMRPADQFGPAPDIH